MFKLAFMEPLVLAPKVGLSPNREGIEETEKKTEI
jgi:hypothetical protein